MVSIINLEDLPQLVMEKITSFLSYKQLVALEQVSRKLKCIVDVHFSLTDQIIIGSLPRIEEDKNDEPTANRKKCLDCFLKLVTRCGIRLQTIHIYLNDQYGCNSYRSLWNYIVYFKHIFESPEVSRKCPNIESIIASFVVYIDDNMVHQQNILLDVIDTEIYANNVRISKGESCKLRSISLPHSHERQHSYERILDLYSNLKHIAVYDYDYGENFYKFLPQFIKNGLTDLKMLSTINIQVAKKYCDIGKDLRTLHFALTIGTDDDIAHINKLQLPKNVTLDIGMSYFYVGDFFALLNENVCSAVIKCNINSTIDCSLMTKFKNLQKFNIRTSEQCKVLAEGSFPELRQVSDYEPCCIRSWSERNCSDITTKCDLHTFLLPLLTSKGNQLFSIDVPFVYCMRIDEVWKALKHCTAAQSIKFGHMIVDWPLSVTTDDMKAICQLPNLQYFWFKINQRLEDDTCRLLHDLMQREVKRHADFQFQYKYNVCDNGSVSQEYLCRIQS